MGKTQMQLGGERLNKQKIKQVLLRVSRRKDKQALKLVEKDGQQQFLIELIDGGTDINRQDKLDQDIVKSLISDGALVLKQKQVFITKAGKALLRRLMVTHDPFIAQHQQQGTKKISDEKGRTEFVKINHKESPLAWLAQRKTQKGTPFLSPVLVLAGERLRSDFERAHLEPSVTMNWDLFAGTGQAKRYKKSAKARQIADSAIGARVRLQKALQQVGPDLAPVLFEVCCSLSKLETLEKKFAWPRRSGKLILRLALQALARHYGLLKTDRALFDDQLRAEKQPILHWGDETYCPNIQS